MKPKWQPLPALMSPHLENYLNEFINVSKITPLTKSAPLPRPPQLSRSYLAQSFGIGASQTDGGAETREGGVENKSRCGAERSEMSEESPFLEETG